MATNPTTPYPPVAASPGVFYDPSVPANWGATKPTNVEQALDQIAAAGGSINPTLQAAYNGGASVVEAAGVVIAFSNNAANNAGVLTLTKNPVGAQSGSLLTLTMGATTTGAGATFSMTAGSTGPAISLSGGTSLFYESTDGSTSALSGAATGRLRYNNTTGAFEASVKGGAYAALGGGTTGVVGWPNAVWSTGGTFSLVNPELLGPSDNNFYISTGGAGGSFQDLVLSSLGSTGDIDLLCAATAEISLQSAGQVRIQGGGTDRLTVFQTGSVSIKAGGAGLFASAVTKTLSNTTNTTTTFALLSTISNSSIGGQVFFTVEANDGTNWNSTSGFFQFAAVNQAGTTSVFAGTIAAFPGTICNSGTLVLASAATTSGTSLALQITPNWTTIVPTTVRITYTIMAFGTTTVTPQ